MIGSEIQVLNAQIPFEVHTFVSCKGVAAIAASGRPSLVSQRDHMLLVQTLDISRCCLGPVVDDISTATTASSLVRQLPCENCWTIEIATHDSFDVSLILGLNCRVRIPITVLPTKESIISRHATIGIPIINKIHNQLDAMGLRRLYCIVQSLEAICAGIDDRCLAGDEGLEPDAARGWRAGDVVEAPDTQDFDAGGDEVAEYSVNVGVRGQETEPVGIRAGKVFGLIIDLEEETIGGSDFALGRVFGRLGRPRGFCWRRRFRRGRFGDCFHGRRRGTWRA